MIGKLLLGLGLALAITSIAAATEQQSAAAGAELVVCSEPRPQICTHDYSPVCATRDTGVRCVRAPCPATENKTYSNGCTACSDKDVIRYQPGRCAADAPRWDWPQ